MEDDGGNGTEVTYLSDFIRRDRQSSIIIRLTTND